MKKDEKWYMTLFSYIIIGIGVFIMSIGLNYFLSPNTIAPGGVTGFAVVIERLINIPIYITNLLINIPLFIFGARALGRSTAIKTLYSTLLLSLFLKLLPPAVLTHDLLLSSIFGGVLTGAGLGMVFKFGGTTGGTDLAGAMINGKFPNLSLATAMMMIDLIVVVFAGIVERNIEISLYSVIAMFASIKVIDLILEGVGYLKAFYIITNMPEKIGDVPKVEDQADGGILTINDYYPFKENIIMDYEGIGNEYAEQKTFMEFVEGNRAQMKIINPGTTFVKVLEYKGGELTEVFSEGEFYHIENMLNVTSNSNDIILKEPLEIGTTWLSAGGNDKKITSIDQSIETPSGTYKALEVTTELKDGGNQKQYYAKDIGLVASVHSDGEFEVKTLLKKIDNNPYEAEITAYYPTMEDSGIEYVKSIIKFNTNDNIENVLEDIMKNPPTDKLKSPISKGTIINKIHLNRSSWTLEVDFSSELLTEMNAGSSFETEILKSITNTLGVFYDVDKVYITTDGEPYGSGHYEMREGEYFEVDIKGIKEFNK